MASFPFQNEMPSNEAFDAMNDAAFCDCWDAAMERVQAQAVDESEVEACDAARKAAEARRFAD